MQFACQSVKQRFLRVLRQFVRRRVDRAPHLDLVVDNFLSLVDRAADNK
jgi:hypothetical protein